MYLSLHSHPPNNINSIETGINDNIDDVSDDGDCGRDDKGHSRNNIVEYILDTDDDFSRVTVMQLCSFIRAFCCKKILNRLTEATVAAYFFVQTLDKIYAALEFQANQVSHISKLDSTK